MTGGSRRQLCFCIALSVFIVTIFSCTGGAGSSKNVVSGMIRVMIDSVQQRFDTIRLGRLNEGEVASGLFFVVNDKQLPLVISNIVTGCGCTTTQYDSQPIMPGEEREIKYMFDTHGRRGLQLKTIDIISAEYLMNRIVIEADVTDRK